MLQKGVIRLMHNAQRFDHTAPLFYKSCMFKFIDLVQFRIVLLMYKAHKNELPLNVKKKMCNAYEEILHKKAKPF